MKSARVVVCYFSMKIDIVRQNKYLLDIVALNLTLLVAVLGVIKANSYHFTNHSADDEQNATVHAGNRVVNNYDFILAYCLVIMATSHKVIEVKESNKVSFAVAEVVGNGTIWPYHLIYVLLPTFFSQSEALKARIA